MGPSVSEAQKLYRCFSGIIGGEYKPYIVQNFSEDKAFLLCVSFHSLTSDIFSAFFCFSIEGRACYLE